jgi:23S rRNA (guanosine2251-2'-O)-methyltransferase
MPEKRWDPRQTHKRPGGPPRDKKDKSRFAPKPKPVRPGIPEGIAILYGWHTVAAALANPRRKVRKIFATENGAHRLTEEGLTLPVTPEIVRPDAIAARLSPDAVHQGLLVEAEPLPALELEDLGDEGTVLVLDQITDPHNVGAILRSAAAFGVTAIVTTARHSPEATGVLAKSASGALDLVPTVTVQNLARALTELKERGWLTVGLDSEGETDLAAAGLREPLALVLGAEGKGLRALTRETCEIRARLALPGVLKSLNVSNAAAVALYAVAQGLHKS